ncbi:MAG: hypothetical protein II567_11875 [Candidatus Riflebacteria bacterium]|nr:hypothetical protein [Candidatus Riflebacteria bacterium]
MDKNQNKNRIRNITLNGIMLAVIMALQAANLPNLVTGVIVNSILVFVSSFSGMKSAVLLCLLSPFCGFLTGHVPVLMYPVLPMIVLGNIILVLLLFKLREKSMVTRLLIPALTKAVIIGAGGFALVNIFLPDEIANFLLFSVLGIQFFTAVPGVFLGLKLAENVRSL